MKGSILKKLILLNFIFNGVAFAETCEQTGDTSTPISRFIIDGEKGFAIDKSTNLMWKRCLEGGAGSDCHPESGQSLLSINWVDALFYAEHHDYAGFTDWRLPNTRELLSIYDYECFESRGVAQNHGINFSLFPVPDLVDLKLIIWTSTYPSDPESNYAIRYFLNEGPYGVTGVDPSERVNLHNLRLVRDVTPLEFEPELTQGGK